MSVTDIEDTTFEEHSGTKLIADRAEDYDSRRDYDSRHTEDYDSRREVDYDQD